MSLEKLEDALEDLANYKKLSQTTACKIIETRNKKFGEEALSHSLKHELTLKSLEIEQIKREVSNLEVDQQRFVELNLELLRSAKMLRNHSAINRMRMDLKEKKIAKLRDEFSTVDFELAAKEFD